MPTVLPARSTVYSSVYSLAFRDKLDRESIHAAISSHRHDGRIREKKAQNPTSVERTERQSSTVYRRSKSASRHPPSFSSLLLSFSSLRKVARSYFDLVESARESHSFDAYCPFPVIINPRFHDSWSTPERDRRAQPRGRYVPGLAWPGLAWPARDESAVPFRGKGKRAGYHTPTTS